MTDPIEPTSVPGDVPEVASGLTPDLPTGPVPDRAPAPAWSGSAPDLAPPPPPAGAPLTHATPIAQRDLTRWVTALLVVVLAISMFATGSILGRTGLLGGPLGGESPVPSGEDKQLALIEEAWRHLHESYVDAKSLDDRKLAYAAIRALTDAVGDPGHTSFLTADEMKAFDQSLSGSFVGVGVQVAIDSSGVVVVSVLPETPAEAAGLRRGDRIIAVDGKTTTGETIDEVVARVRGPEGVPVTLTVNRAGVPQFDVKIVRRTLERQLVTWTMIPGRKVAFIRLEQFASNATKELKAAIEKATAAGATALVFDLRGNGGGYVSEAIGVASQFVASGTVYQSVDASGTQQDVAVQPGGIATTIPLIVLADGGSASAAEIVSGAIQDAGRARVVGTKTFGTGTVTNRYDLADGSSLRIGVERWLTRAGRPIWHEGLDPDVTVELASDAQTLVPDDVRGMSAAELEGSSDAQLRKALDLLAGQG